MEKSDEIGETSESKEPIEIVRIDKLIYTEDPGNPDRIDEIKPTERH